MTPTRRSPLLVVLALAVAACSPAFLMPGGSFSSPALLKALLTFATLWLLNERSTALIR